MRVSLVLSLTLTAIALSACAKKGNSTRDENGNCTSGYIDDHNSLARSLREVGYSCKSSSITYSSYSCEASAQSVLSSCATYQAHHPAGRSCTAEDTRYGGSVTVDTSTIHDACNMLRESINRARTTTATTTTTTIPGGVDGNLTSPAYARLKYGLSSSTKFASEFPSCEAIRSQAKWMRYNTIRDIRDSASALKRASGSDLSAKRASDITYLYNEELKLNELARCAESENL